MTDWFDIFMRVITCIALFMAGYNIGWSRGFEKCREYVQIAIKDITKTLDTKEDKDVSRETKDGQPSDSSVSTKDE